MNSLIDLLLTEIIRDIMKFMRFINEIIVS